MQGVEALKRIQDIHKVTKYIQSLSGIKTELVDGDEVAIFPPVAGG